MLRRHEGIGFLPEWNTMATRCGWGQPRSGRLANGEVADAPSAVPTASRGWIPHQLLEIIANEAVGKIHTPGQIQGRDHPHQATGHEQHDRAGHV